MPYVVPPEDQTEKTFTVRTKDCMYTYNKNLSTHNLKSLKELNDHVDGTHRAYLFKKDELVERIQQEISFLPWSEAITAYPLLAPIQIPEVPLKDQIEFLQNLYTDIRYLKVADGFPYGAHRLVREKEASKLLSESREKYRLESNRDYIRLAKHALLTPLTADSDELHSILLELRELAKRRKDESWSLNEEMMVTLISTRVDQVAELLARSNEAKTSEEE